MFDSARTTVHGGSTATPAETEVARLRAGIAALVRHYDVTLNLHSPAAANVLAAITSELDELLDGGWTPVSP